MKELYEHLLQMQRWCDHDGEYHEPTPEKPYDHCDGIFCVRCGINEAVVMAHRLYDDQGKDG